MGNYRLISILSAAFKILELERSIYKTGKIPLLKMISCIIFSLVSVVTSPQTLASSTGPWTDYIKTELSHGNYVSMALLDLQKAFDTVDHSILFNKLQTMGIVSVEWLSPI